MNTHNSVAKSVRLSKESHPENYCQHPKCLWRVVVRDERKPCPKHKASY